MTEKQIKRAEYMKIYYTKNKNHINRKVECEYCGKFILQRDLKRRHQLLSKKCIKIRLMKEDKVEDKIEE